MCYMALLMEKVQSLKKALQHEGHNWLRKSPRRIAMPDTVYVIPEWRMYEALMTSIGAVNIK